jgi:hypothetical protein
MATQTVDPQVVSSQVRRVLDWYTQGFLTEEELIHLLERSMEAKPQRIRAGSVTIFGLTPDGDR